MSKPGIIYKLVRILRISIRNALELGHGNSLTQRFIRTLIGGETGVISLFGLYPNGRFHFSIRFRIQRIFKVVCA